MNLILTSNLDSYSKNKKGERISHNFGNPNGLLDLIKQTAPKQENFLFVASNENAFEITDIYAKVVFESFNKTFPFKNLLILDGRTKEMAKEFVEKADLIFLCGGHVPTQNKFFQNIDLKEIIKNTKALIIGQSAGSMNSADIVYSQPELEGEVIDPAYQRYLKGLGLTKISVLPHFEQELGAVIDGKDILTEVSLPDSKTRPFIAFSDGAFIYDDGKKQEMHGKAFLFKDGEYSQIAEDNVVTDITRLVNQIYPKINLSK